MTAAEPLCALVVGDWTPIGDATAAALEASGARVVLRSGDSSTDAGALRVVAEAVRQLGRLDIVIHAPAPAEPRAFLDRTDASWATDIDARIGGPIRIARAAAEAMRETGGSIVFVGTLDGVHAYEGHAAASVAMGALLGLVRSLGVELAPIGVRANAVMVGPLGDDDAAPPAGADPALVARTRLRSPGGRFVTPAEAAVAIAFVAGPGAAFMTGATLRVDGGWAALNQAPDGMRFP